MNRFVPVLLAAGLTLGCQPSPETTGDVSVSLPATSESTLVTLKVPNMT